MDSSFVSIGDGITVKEAINNALPYLLDANQQLFEIDSDSTPRLIHLRIERGFGGSAWDCSLCNDTLENIAKIYGPAGKAEYNPPRIVDKFGNGVPYDKGGNVTKGPFLDNKIINENLGPSVTAYFPNASGSVTPDELRLRGDLLYRIQEVQEVGCYIIPICYHRTTAKGFESIQVLRSDAPFWPTAPHAVWSVQHFLDEFYFAFQTPPEQQGPQYPLSP